MKEINLGRVLIENRHRRGVTQDEIASHIGVSKAGRLKMGDGDDLSGYHHSAGAGSIF